jgi:hypothetical protein
MQMPNAPDRKRLAEAWRAHRVLNRTQAAFRSLLLRGSIAAGLAWAGPLTGADTSVRLPELLCQAGTPERAAEGGLLVCSLVVPESSNWFLLTSSAFGEGPAGEESQYLYRYIAGDRLENVLQFLPGAGRDLRLPILLKPSIALQLDDLSRFVRVGKGTTAKVSLIWVPSVSGSSIRNWTMRLKLVLVEESAVRKALADLRSRACKGSLMRLLVQQRQLEQIRLHATVDMRPPSLPEDECSKLLSKLARHVVSNSLELQLNTLRELK